MKRWRNTRRGGHLDYWVRHAGTGRLLADLKQQEAPGAATPGAGKPAPHPRKGAVEPWKA